MSYPEGLPAEAFCQMEGCEFHGGAVCTRCGYRLRCDCGRFTREDELDDHYKTCATIERLIEEEAEWERRSMQSGMG